MKNDAVNKFCTECASLTMSSSSFFYSSDVDADPYLEDLIDSISIGKSAVDHVSGKCKLACSSLSKECSQSCCIGGNFDPLTLPLRTETASDIATENKFQSNKRLKHCVNQTTALILKEQKTTEAVEENATSISEKHDISNVDITQRPQRKRRLSYDVTAGESWESNDSRVECQVLRAAVASDNATVLNEREEKNSVLTSMEECCLNDEVPSCIKDPASEEPTHLSFDSETVHSDEEKIARVNGMLPGIHDLQNLSLDEKSPLAKSETTAHPNSISRTSMDTQTDEQACTVVLSQPDADLPASVDVKKVDRSRKKRKSSSEGQSRSLRKRIRKTLPPAKTRQTPLGLPKPLRLKKENFSIEEIYTNKNYSTPVPKLLETIFEYPKEEKDGSLRYSDKKRKQRAVYFSTNPADRPVKKRPKKKFKKRPTRRNERDVETDTKLINALALLDQQLQLNDLSP